MLELVDISKAFGGVAALRGVSVSFGGGRVHGVLGENGAGKSTLMNVAYGMVAADAGEVRVDGRAVRLRSPADAIGAGIGMVHQHFMLAGAMTVLDNVLLGDRRAGRWLRRRAAAGRLREMSERVGLAVEPLARVESLSVGEQQRVEILKALWRDVRVLILDEPTAVLTPGEVGQLFEAVRRLTAEGRAVVFISHKLGEVKAICDDVTVLRRGEVVWRGEAGGVSASELAGFMVGAHAGFGALGDGPDVLEKGEGVGARERALTPALSRSTGRGGEEAHAAPLLALENVTTAVLRGVSLTVGAGEIVGIAGVDGNGQQHLAEVVVGLCAPAAGTVWYQGLDGRTLPFDVRQALGVAHVPNDRKREGLVTTMSVAENVVLKEYDQYPVGRRGIMSWAAARAAAGHWVKEFDVRTPGVDVAVGTLSGGNQQKVVLARELSREPMLTVATNPVRGLDVGATRFVYEQLRRRREAGASVLLISSELDELIKVCDRIAVLYAGRLVMTDFPRTTREEIGRLMAGVGL